MSDLRACVVELSGLLAADPATLPERQAELAAVMQRLLDAVERDAAEADAREEELAAQRELLRAMACPILQVRSDAVCVPLIGRIDADRAALLTGQILSTVARLGTGLVVLDISAALITDLSPLGHIIDILRAVRLLGARGVLSGISPDLASMATSTSTPLTGVPTYGTLKDALADRR